MEHSEIINALENCELFRELAEEYVEKIAGLCRVKAFKPGEFVFRQGDLGECLYIIVEGHIFLERSMDLGPRKGNVVIGILGRGRAFGCWSTLLDKSHNLMSTATCQKATKVLVINGKDLRNEMVNSTELGFNVSQKLCFLLRDRIQDVFGAMEKI